MQMQMEMDVEVDVEILGPAASSTSSGHAVCIYFLLELVYSA